MDDQAIIEHIVHGMNHYVEVLATPPHMEKYNDGICAWIKPKEGAAGPACVYKVNFEDKTDMEIRRMIATYREGGAPDAWFTTPLSTPDGIRDILADLGLMSPVIPDMNDQGMAIPPEQAALRTWSDEKRNSQVIVRKVENRNDFKIWCAISDEVLIGSTMLEPDLYYPLCESGEMVCFLGYSGEKPVATSGTMNNNGNGTLEFIATLPDYRKQGMGTAVCCAALEQLIDDGAYIISLRARAMGASLYTKLGFKVYFNF